MIVVSHNRDLLFLQLRQRFDLFAAGADQHQHVVLQYRERTRARRYLGVGAQHRKVRLPAVELRERLRAIGVGHDLQPQL